MKEVSFDECFLRTSHTGTTASPGLGGEASGLLRTYSEDDVANRNRIPEGLDSAS